MTAPEYEKKEYVSPPKVRETCEHTGFIREFEMTVCDPRKTKVCNSCGLEVQ